MQPPSRPAPKNELVQTVPKRGDSSLVYLDGGGGRLRCDRYTIVAGITGDEVGFRPLDRLHPPKLAYSSMGHCHGNRVRDLAAALQKATLAA